MKINIIKGSLVINDIVCEMYPFALKFYGNKYKKIIDKTIENTQIYERTSEPFRDILFNILNIYISDDKIKQLGYENEFNNLLGFHYIKYNENKDNKNLVVVNKTDDINKLKLILCHELYGHAVCSYKNTMILLNGRKMLRNGINLQCLNKDININRCVNEGMMEYIAEEIYNLSSSNKINNKYYKKSTIVASILFDSIGKEKLLEILVDGKSNIKDVYEINSDLSWSKLSNMLDNDEPISSELKEYIKTKYGVK